MFSTKLNSLCQIPSNRHCSYQRNNCVYTPSGGHKKKNWIPSSWTFLICNTVSHFQQANSHAALTKAQNISTTHSSFPLTGLLDSCGWSIVMTPWRSKLWKQIFVFYAWFKPQGVKLPSFFLLRWKGSCDSKSVGPLWCIIIHSTRRV